MFFQGSFNEKSTAATSVKSSSQSPPEKVSKLNLEIASHLQPEVAPEAALLKEEEEEVASTLHLEKEMDSTRVPAVVPTQQPEIVLSPTPEMTADET